MRHSQYRSGLDQPVKARKHESSSGTSLAIPILFATLLLILVLLLVVANLSARYQAAVTRLLIEDSNEARAKSTSFRSYPKPIFDNSLLDAANQVLHENARLRQSIIELEAEKHQLVENHGKIAGLFERIKFTTKHNPNEVRALFRNAIDLVGATRAQSLIKTLESLPSPKIVSSDVTVQQSRIASSNTIAVQCRSDLGGFVSGLRRVDFQVQDGQGIIWPHFDVKETTLAANLSVVVLVDRSSSMNGERMEQLKLAVKSFVTKVSNQAAVQIIAFDSQVRPLTDFEKDSTRLIPAIDSLIADGATQIADAIRHGVSELNKRQGIRSLVLCTDGEDEKLRANLEQIIASCTQTKISVNVLAIDDRALDLSTLKALASRTSGVLALASQPNSIAGRMDEIVKRYSTPQYDIEVFAPGKFITDFTVSFANQSRSPDRTVNR